jgi:hypothetical protein
MGNRDINVEGPPTGRVFRAIPQADTCKFGHFGELIYDLDHQALFPVHFDRKTKGAECRHRVPNPLPSVHTGMVIDGSQHIAFRFDP